MERKVVVVCIVLGFLGLLAAVLGFASEATRVKPSDVQTTALGECMYPRSPAFALGIMAVLALTDGSGNYYHRCWVHLLREKFTSSDTNWIVGLLSLIVSWVTFIIAFAVLLTGVALNDRWQGEQTMYYSSCYVVKPGLFSAGAVFSLASVALGIVYYVTQSSASNHNQGITLGHPQTTQPV